MRFLQLQHRLMRFSSLLILFAVLLEGCGYKGALYLPEQPPAAQSQPAPQPQIPQKQDQDPQQGPQAR
ncbi:MAG: LPS translocon maturation chaperone LptM [Burkholderiales bacterium]